MPRCRTTSLLAFGVLAAAAPAWAGGLQWERPSVEVTAQPGQRVVHVEFPFQNTGERVVTLVSLETSCRCTSADSSKKSYGPREKDVIRVDFTVGAQDGVVDKSVTVTTDGPELKLFVLSLRVTLPAQDLTVIGTLPIRRSLR